MTDIVERLRACHGIESGDPDCCCVEAAAEIERLRAIADTDTPELEMQHEEILRLRAALEEIKGKYAWQTEAGAIARKALTDAK